MEDSEKKSEILIRYLDGELNEEELKDFERVLSGSIRMQKELENLIVTREAIRSYGLKKQVASVHREMMTEFESNKSEGGGGTRKFSFNISLSIAASLLIFMLTAGIYEYATLSDSVVFIDKYQPYSLSISRGEDRTNSKISEAYKQGRPEVVIREFESLREPGGKDYFLAGQAYLSINQGEKAIKGFQQVLSHNSPDHLFVDDAEYYLALAFLKYGQPAKALALFENIRHDNDHLYHDQVSIWTIYQVRILAFKDSYRH